MAYPYKLGLVLEGGGMRGLYTCGILDTMMERGLVPDVVSGTSAGVTFGINICSGQRGRALRYNLKYAGKREYISLHSLLTTGDIVNTKFAYDLLPRTLDPFDQAAMDKAGIVFFATITNCQTGKAEYVRVTDCFEQMDVIRASASLPFVSRPVMINGVPYLDGGLTDNIPLDYCLENCEKVIVVLTRPKDYVRHENLVTLARILYPHYKNLHEALRHRDERYNARIQQIEGLANEGRITLIRPSESLHIGRLERDPKRMMATYELGLKDARQLDGLCS